MIDLNISPVLNFVFFCLFTEERLFFTDLQYGIPLYMNVPIIT